MNKNDKPYNNIDEIRDINFDSIPFANKFTKICSLYPNKKLERLELIDVLNDDIINKNGLIYCFVHKNKLLKVGCTTTSLSKRIISYNCGKEKYRFNGTCSTTNFFVLQSLLNFNVIIDVYCYFPEQIKVDVFGSIETSSLPVKLYEKCILSKLKKMDIFPSFCTQR